MADGEKQQEAWNMATETLKRLSRCLDLCSWHSQKGDLVAWFDTSMDLRRNLAAFLDDNEFKQIDDKLKSLPRGWIIGGRVSPNHFAAVHKTLDDVYIIAIKAMKEKGLLMPKAPNAAMAVINN